MTDSDREFKKLWDKYTVNRIAKVLGIKPASVKVRACRLRKRGMVLARKDGRFTRKTSRKALEARWGKDEKG